MSKSTIISLLLVPLALAQGRIINVPAEYASIQAAINASVNGDTVLVQPGTYAENINFRGKRIVLTSRYMLTANPVDIVITTIYGGNPANPDTASCVIINSGEDSTTILQGFTLTGGAGTKWLDEHGAGVYVEGGGVLVQHSSPVIRYNRIVYNSAIRRPSGTTSAGGGAIRIGDGRPKILNNVIMHNSGMYGGGIVLNYTGATIRNNIIAKNSVYQAVTGAPTFGGGGLWVFENFGTAPKIIKNNTIVGNSVLGSAGNEFAGKGGGMLVGYTSATIRNNIIWGNTQLLGGPIGVITAGTASVSYSDVQGGFAGTGNINLDPMFNDSSYFLLPGSPGIDAGDSSAGFNDPADPGNPGFAQWPSMGTLRNDMGVYGGPARSWFGYVVTGVSGSNANLPTEATLSQNFPNPFNPGTTIRFSISRASFVTLRVYNLLGQEVATLVEGEVTAGEQQVAWDARGVPSGVYFYKLRAGAFVQTRKLTLIK